ncbi:MAG: phytanoyl-CoA dioxygenase family protein [Alphaproteobacteria bacterium]
MAQTDYPSRLAAPLPPSVIAAYESDGATVVRGVVPPVWIERMRQAIDRVLAKPGRAAVEYTPKDRPGRYYGDFFVWQRDPDFRAFMADSPLPHLAAEIMGSREVRFFYDQLLVKEPNTAEATPWHQDLPYWPLRGSQILSLWVPFDRATLETGVVVYVKGSHRWGKMFAPAAFGKDSGFADVFRKMNMEPVPDIEAERDQYDILTWEVEPGDLIVHHPLALHYASGNASPTARRRGLALRYVGDDARWDDRPGTFLQHPRMQALLPDLKQTAGRPLAGDFFPRVWPRD